MPTQKLRTARRSDGDRPRKNELLAGELEQTDDSQRPSIEQTIAYHTAARKFDPAVLEFGEPHSLLAKAIYQICPMLGIDVPPAERLQIFWKAVVAARDLAALDRVKQDFFWLAIQSGLIGHMGGRGAEQLQRVLDCGLRGEAPAPADLIVEDGDWQEMQKSWLSYLAEMESLATLNAKLKGKI
jgi:hypothetical protein